MIDPPPACTGTGTLMADFSPAMSKLPSVGRCGICGRMVPVFMHDFAHCPRVLFERPRRADRADEGLLLSAQLARTVNDLSGMSGGQEQPMTRPASESDVKQAKAAAKHVEDWDGADHFEDCPALKHADGECDCPEDGCPDPDEGCDCYLGAMRDCRESILALLSSHDRLTRFMALLEPDPADREAVLNDPEYWSADYRHAMSQLESVEAIETRANKLADENDRLTREVERLRGLIVATDKPWGPGLDPMGDLLTEARAIREAKPE